MENNYRAYFFQNMYLQGIHAGIQPQHTTAEMFVKYGFDTIYFDQESVGYKCQQILKEWATNHKTTIVLNGALTNVGIILPARIYGSPQPYDDEYLKYMKDNNITDFEDQLIQVLKSKRLF